MKLIDREMKAVESITAKSNHSLKCQASFNSDGVLTLRNYNMGKLCRDCPNCKSAKTGAVSNRYWCGLTGNGYNGKAMGVYPWKNKPHPKCHRKGEL